MKQALVRDIEDDLLDDYRSAARQNMRSLNAELRDGLRRGRPGPRRKTVEELRALCLELWAMTPPAMSDGDSTSYIRWSRDTNGGDWGAPIDDARSS